MLLYIPPLKNIIIKKKYMKIYNKIVIRIYNDSI